MKVNYKGAANSAFYGIKAIGDVLEDYQNGGIRDDQALERIEQLFLEYQPQAAAYTVAEYFMKTPQQADTGLDTENSDG